MSTDGTVTLELRSAEAPPVATVLEESATYSLTRTGRLEASDTAGELDQPRFLARDREVIISPPIDDPLLLNGRPVAGPTAVKHGDWLTIGNVVYQLKIDYGSARGPDLAIPAKVEAAVSDANATVTGNCVIIGRLPACTLTIDSPLVSREHAKLVSLDGNWIIEDLGSSNGTFVNGRRITRPTQLAIGDKVSIATFVYRFTGRGLRAEGEDGRVRIEATGLKKIIGARRGHPGRAILDDISLVIEPGEFVVIFGGSGSGKSTLLDALNGRRPANEGHVAYNGVNLYQSFDAFSTTIGYVPQQDIVHRHITIRRALAYAARLRLPPDTSNEEIEHHILEVLRTVRLDEQVDFRIDTPAPLSGGQLKRVSLAVELIADPGVLFLDEVTSGLDAGTDRQMMSTFAELAAGGKTVVCVTHTLENISSCHLVALLHKGKLAFFGPPGRVLQYFGINRFAEIYDLLETREAAVWADQYANSKLHREYITARMRTQFSDELAHGKRAGNHSIMARRAGQLFQAAILTRRYVDLFMSDTKNLAILVLQAPLIGAILGVVFDFEGPVALRAATEVQVSFVLTLSAIWFGCLNSAREIVKELPIYLRERAVGLRLAPYLASKLVPQVFLCTLQCCLLLGVTWSMLPLSGSFLSKAALLSLTAFAGAAMGLAVSAFVDSNDKAIATIPILLIPQVILSNAVAQLNGVNLWFAKLTMLSFWAFDGLKAALSDEVLDARSVDATQVVSVLGGYTQSMLVIAAMAAAMVGLATFGLKLKDRR
ncbi:MAG: ATP-binding cassette domain-containing protein [Gammaproteobacteria bacterium]